MNSLYIIRRVGKNSITDN